jgi:hypothetical protein
MKKHKIMLTVAVLTSVYLINTFAQNQKPVATHPAVQSQTPFLTPEEKREQRKNLVVKEMNTDAKGKRQWMDHLTVWNENGFKIEEIEYAVYGQKERVTFEYDETGKCIRENVYNDKNKLYRIRKYEYLSNGRKKIQYNYNPDGKLYSTKIYEYAYK